jgi:hypothetical protein
MLIYTRTHQTGHEIDLPIAVLFSDRYAPASFPTGSVVLRFPRRVRSIPGEVILLFPYFRDASDHVFATLKSDETVDVSV